MTLPIHLHSHATSGLAELCQLKAIENGCRHIETAFTAFAGGASHPPCESMVAAGTPVLVTEAMKMESEIHAPVSGRVTHVYVAKGDRVMPGEALIEIEG